MRYLLIFVFSIVTFSVFSNEENVIIKSPHELRNWCEAETESFYVANNITPFNWSSSEWIKGNALFVKGNWKIGRETVWVNCRIQKGARAKYAVYEFLDR